MDSPAGGAWPDSWRWRGCWPRAPDIAPFPGTTRVRYLEEDVGALDVVLSAEDLAAIEAAVPTDAVVGDRYADMTSIDR